MTAGIDRTVLFSGRVQGVGFRWRALHALEGCGLDGYVRNLPDGRVELRLQGEAEDIDQAVARVRAAMADYIHRVESSECKIDERLGGFRIRGYC